MNLRRTLAISRRIADLFRRDHRTLALMFVAPIVIMALLGWVIRDQGPSETNLGIVNTAGAPGEIVRGRLGDALTAHGLASFDITTEGAARQALVEDQIDVALVIGLNGQAPAIKVLTLGLNPTQDSGHVAALQQALREALLGGTGPLLTMESVYATGEGGFFDAFAPALVGFVVFFLVFILTGISFLRERIGGTLERLLATPVRKTEIVGGYSLGFSIFATIQVALILLFVLGTINLDLPDPLPDINFGLGVPIAGSPILAFVITLLLALAAVNLGIFLSTFARTEFQILQFIPLVVVPQALLAGIIWPVESLPGVLQPIARLMPMTYGIDGLREVLIKGSGLGALAVQLDIAVLAGIALVLAIAASLTIRREVA
ncbi:MAG: type transport system permease protein [Chloroflexota bacterium]|jgi:ABC-2 type transport system permease protein|nr:type transport system permease protein [Chloroflexota bacterium]